jgi:hypothetical protein
LGKWENSRTHRIFLFTTMLDLLDFILFLLKSQTFPVFKCLLVAMGRSILRFRRCEMFSRDVGHLGRFNVGYAA